MSQRREAIEYVQLEATDDVTSVRDRLSFLRGKRVLLIWPEEGTVLTRKLDLVLVQREAMRLAIRLAVVTHDPLVIRQANELNISTFETIGSASRGRWRRGRSKVFTTRWQRPEDEPEPNDLRDVASRVSEDADARRRTPLALRLLVLALLVGAVLAVAYVLLPSATVTITPAQALLQVQLEILANPQIATVDVENSVMPALTLRVEIEETGTIPTTGSQTLSDTVATGSVVFINQTNREVEIPAETTVSTSAGTPILFRTTEDAIAPAEAGGQIEVPIEALPGSSGPIGNVDTGLINTIVGPLADSLEVRNLSPTSGGENRSVRAVSQDDYDTILATLRQQLQARAYLGMESLSSESQIIVLETIRIAEERNDWKTFSAQPGEIADTLTLTMRAVVEATAIEQTSAQQIAFAVLTAQIPPGRALKPETLVYDCCAVQQINPDGTVLMGMSGEAMIAGQVNPGLLRDRLAGRSQEDAVRYLLAEVDMAENTRPIVQVQPEWLGQLPVLPSRITIRILDAPGT